MTSELISVENAAKELGISIDELAYRVERAELPDPVGDDFEVYSWSLGLKEESR